MHGTSFYPRGEPGNRRRNRRADSPDNTAQSLNVMGAWLNNHREYPLYDRTVSQFALRSATDDPESARHWASSIKDADLKARTLERPGVNE